MNLRTVSGSLLRNTPAWGLIQRIEAWRTVRIWERAAKPRPPPHAVKRRIVSDYALSYGTNTLVETGTYLGEMIYAMRNNFQMIYSIELSDALANKASRRFRAYHNIRILAGDSRKALPRVLSDISIPCLFWLDGHYSGGITAKGETDSPIIEEVTAILGHRIKTHVLLIDDARCFDGTEGYPALDALRELVRLRGQGYNLSVADDVIRIVPETGRSHTGESSSARAN